MTRTIVALTATLLLLPAPLLGHLLMNTPDGRVIESKEGTAQPDLSSYRSPLKSKVSDRRFYTGDAQFAANEMYFTGQSGFADMVRAVFPLRGKTAFHWVTHQEAYWYARWSMFFGGATSHCGVSMIHGPYWTVKAQELSRKNRFQRDRGERPLSNKDVMLGFYFPLLYKRVGIPRVFDDMQPSYLEFASGMPFFTGKIVVADDFQDPQSDKTGAWGVPRYWYDGRPFRWDHDSMDVTIDMGGVAQTNKRRGMWIAYMFKANHIEDSPSGTGEKITLLGNDSEEGLRGAVLTWMNTNQLLALKAELAADVKGNLGGVNPLHYQPENGLRYFPHLIHPNLVLLGDIPERPWAFDIQDDRSLLWDQASLIWATTEYFHQVYRLPEVFTTNPPVDGGIVEKSMGQVARGLSNMIVRNLEAMHVKNGLLVSEWSPKKGAGTTVSVKDLAMAILALREYVDRYHEINAVEALGADEDKGIDPDLTKKAMALLKQQAEFLLAVQAADGSFNETYDVVSRKGTGETTVARSQFAAIRGLLAAYDATEEERYAAAARKTWNLLAQNYYDEVSGLFRTEVGNDVVTLTPYDVGIQLGAIREIMFATPVHLIEPMVDWFPRWWVQTVDTSGMQQAEDNRTGELFYGVRDADFDNDGIPFTGKGPGRYGIAPVLAGKVGVVVGNTNPDTFSDLKGEVDDPAAWGGKVQYRYAAGSLPAPVLPVTVEGDDLVERSPMKRFDGMMYPLPASKRPQLAARVQLSGKQLIEKEGNCVLCHGWTGEGITGLPWKADAFERDRDSMFEIPKTGRFSRLMPEWGIGNQDAVGSVLSNEEIYRIVDYVQSEEFRTLITESQAGIIQPQFPPKDAYFYISRAYLNGRAEPATEKDILTVLKAYEKAVATNTKVNVLPLLGAHEPTNATVDATEERPVLTRSAHRSE